MDWDVVTAVGEIVGAVAVVVSLVYLAVQVREGSRATRATVYQGFHDSIAQFEHMLNTDPSLRRLFNKACAGDTELSEEERLRSAEILAALFNKYELFFILNREKVFTPDVEATMSRIVARRMGHPGVQAWWAENSSRFSPEFGRWLHRLRED